MLRTLMMGDNQAARPYHQAHRASRALNPEKPQRLFHHRLAPGGLSARFSIQFRDIKVGLKYRFGPRREH